MTEAAKRFEDLWIWQQSRLLTRSVYRDFDETSPAAKDFGFRNQIQRAAISIMNNIAEGFERTSNQDIARFLDIARGSCGEVRNMYYLAEDLSYVTAEIADERRNICRKISSGITSFATHVRGRNH